MKNNEKISESFMYLLENNKKTFKIIFGREKYRNSVKSSDMEIRMNNGYMAELDQLTMQLSIYKMQNNEQGILNIIPRIKEIIFENLELYTYGILLYDICDFYILQYDFVKAELLLCECMQILEDRFGMTHIIGAMQSVMEGRILHKMENYEESNQVCLAANELLMQEDLETELDDEDHIRLVQRFAGELRLINFLTLINNLLQMNCIDQALEILNAVVLDYPQLPEKYQSAVDIAFAQIYASQGKKNEARVICEKYRMLARQYPDLYLTLKTIECRLNDVPEKENESDVTFVEGHFSKGGLETVLYNKILGLISEKKYEEALQLSDRIEKAGALRMLLYDRLQKYDEIAKERKQINQYYDRMISNLILYYDAQNVYNRLNILEIHFSLCLNAYIDAHLNDTNSITAEQIYDFVLNTKYISLEVNYLLKKYNSLEELDHRERIYAKDVQKELDSDTILLEYVVLRDDDEVRYAVFILTKEKIYVQKLTTIKVIDDEIIEWHKVMHASLQKADNQSFRNVDSLLRRYLFLPVKRILENHAEKKNIMIASTGSLTNFPFSRLSISAREYLDDKYTISYINTGKELVLEEKYSHDIFSYPIVIGNPANTSMADLPFARKEAVSVAELLGVIPYLDEEANVNLFVDEENQRLIEPSLLHMATHGIFESTEVKDFMSVTEWNEACYTMENSGLVMADDYLLSCIEVQALDLHNTGLVVLSACESGKSVVHEAEGSYGLRRAFKLAGAHAMIVTLWHVEDSSCCFFMEIFYHLLKAYKNAHRAFHEAVNEMKNYELDGVKIYENPYYWAGFIFLQ